MNTKPLNDVEEEIPITEIFLSTNKEISSYEGDEIIDYEEVAVHALANGDDIDEVYLDENCMEIADDSSVKDELDIDEPDLYHCSTCNVNFTSIENHINEYHGDQEVLVDLNDKGDDDNDEIITPTSVTDEQLPIKIEEPDEDNNEEENNFFMGNDGIMYVRQVMQINSPNNEPNEYALTTSKYTITSKLTIPADALLCEVCSCPFATEKSLKVHMRVHNGNANTRKKAKLLAEQDQTCVCPECKTIFKSFKSLKLHSRMHLPIKQQTLEEATEHDIKLYNKKDPTVKEMFYCEICDKSYDVQFKDIHMETHDGEEKFMCTTCNKKFATETHLIMHLNAHQEARVIQTKAEKRNIRLPYACQYCNKEFARPHEKVKHERIHTGEKPHSCEICGKTFRVSYCLTLHMRTHTDARPYVCPHCNKRYKAHAVYNHHLLTHSDVRGYQCPYCPKAFKTAVQLCGHKNSHTKPFACTECNRPFATLYAVKSHMESHKRANHNLKHSCHICGASYARGFALKDHIAEQHAGVLDNTDIILMDEDGIVSKDGIDDEETQMAGQSILQNDNAMDGTKEDIAVTISEIDQFVSEEVVTDWLK